MVRKIVDPVPNDTLQQDLQRYRRRALDFGATDAKIITTDMILVDERVRAKCLYPKCSRYGTNANCPPYAMELDQVRRVVSSYKYAIFVKLEVPSADEAGPEARDKGLFIRGIVKLHEIVSRLEAEAFYDGYHLALGFASGSCKSAFCPNTPCSALVPGQPCRHPMRSRPSVEGVGMDVFTMAARAGWDMYPIGPSISPEDVPHGTKIGLVLIH